MLNTQFTKQGKDSCFPCVNQVKKFVMREITKEELDLWTRISGAVDLTRMPIANHPSSRWLDHAKYTSECLELQIALIKQTRSLEYGSQKRVKYIELSKFLSNLTNWFKQKIFSILTPISLDNRTFLPLCDFRLEDRKSRLNCIIITTH